TTATDEKDVRGRPFGDETLLSKEDRLLRSGEPSLAKRKHDVEEVAALDRRIERVGADAAKRRDDDRDSPIRTARRCVSRDRRRKKLGRVDEEPRLATERHVETDRSHAARHRDAKNGVIERHA